MGPEDNKDEIHKAFVSYVRHAADLLQRRPLIKEKKAAASPKLAYLDPASRLRSIVDKAERSSRFGDLCSALARVLNKKDQNTSRGAMSPYDEAMASSCLVMASSGLGNFFRRSRFYLTAFNGERLSTTEMFNHFWSSLLHRQVKTTILRILDDVEFASRVLDFGIFKIQKFTKNELEVLTDKQVNDVFYPYARLDTNVLSQDWLLVNVHTENRGVKAKTDPSGATTADFNQWQWEAVKPQVPDSSIQLLAMHEWTPDLSEEECLEMNYTEIGDIRGLWSGLSVSGSLTFNDDVFSEPESLPNLSVGERATVSIPISQQQETKIKTTVEKGRTLLKIVDRVKPRWDFVEVTMGYLAKATLAKPDLEQLLWNVTVLESLLGEKGEVMKTMKRRLGNILGATEEEKDEIHTEFDKLYDFRSDLVHGNTFKKRATYHHLAKARELARRVTIWFLDYLIAVDKDFHQRGIAYEQYPRRSELLSAVDADKAALNPVSLLISRLPTGSPTLNK